MHATICIERSDRTVILLKKKKYQPTTKCNRQWVFYFEIAYIIVLVGTSDTLMAVLHFNISYHALQRLEYQTSIIYYHQRTRPRVVVAQFSVAKIFYFYVCFFFLFVLNCFFFVLTCALIFLFFVFFFLYFSFCLIIFFTFFYSIFFIYFAFCSLIFSLFC